MRLHLFLVTNSSSSSLIAVSALWRSLTTMQSTFSDRQTGPWIWICENGNKNQNVIPFRSSECFIPPLYTDWSCQILKSPPSELQPPKSVVCTCAHNNIIIRITINNVIINFCMTNRFEFWIIISIQDIAIVLTTGENHSAAGGVLGCKCCP